MKLPNFWKVFLSALAVVSAFAFPESALAITCTDVSSTSICGMANSLNMSDIKEAIIAVATLIVGVMLLIFGGKLVISWAKGRG